jgi:hypothetical protein
VKVFKDLFGLDISYNKHEPTAAVVIRPLIDPEGRINCVLGALYEGWHLRPVRRIREADDALNSQQVLPAIAREASQVASKLKARASTVQHNDMRRHSVRMRGLLRRVEPAAHIAEILKYQRSGVGATRVTNFGMWIKRP